VTVAISGVPRAAGWAARFATKKARSNVTIPEYQWTPVEMVIYPRQGHGPSEPRLIMDIMARNLAWFDRWLKD
jgi:hypothetical protein